MSTRPDDGALPELWISLLQLVLLAFSCSLTLALALTHAL